MLKSLEKFLVSRKSHEILEKTKLLVLIFYGIFGEIAYEIFGVLVLYIENFLVKFVVHLVKESAKKILEEIIQEITVDFKRNSGEICGEIFGVNPVEISGKKCGDDFFKMGPNLKEFITEYLDRINDKPIAPANFVLPSSRLMKNAIQFQKMPKFQISFLPFFFFAFLETFLNFFLRTNTSYPLLNPTMKGSG